jgi:MFS family permease
MTADEGRWHEMLRPPYFLPLVTLALGVALFAFNIFFAVTSIPTAVGDLGGLAYLTWTTSLYQIFAIVTGAAAGLAKEKLGARPVFLGATAVFAMGALLAGFAPTMPSLLAGRALQGAGAGLIEGLSYAMIPVLFPPRLVPKVFGVEATMWVLAAFGGPAVAGYLTSHFSWRFAMLSSLPLALVFAVLVLRVVPRELPSGSIARFPGIRLGLIATGLLLVTFSSVMAPAMAMLLNAGAIAAILFGFVFDRRALDRLFPRGAFSLAVPFGLGFWVVVLMAIPESAIAAFMPYGVQHLWGATPTMAGALHSVLALSWSATQILVATFASAKWRRELIWVGTALLAVGLFAASAGIAFHSIALLVVAQIFSGAAFGINWGSISQVLMESAPEDEQSLSSALLPTAQTGGFAIGASLAGLTGNLLGFAQAGSSMELERVITMVFAIAAIAAIPVIPMAWKVVRAAKA